MILSGKHIFKKEKDEYIHFTGKYMEVFIPEFFFDREFAEPIGDHFKTLGILNFINYKDADGKNPEKVRTFNLPIELHTYPTGETTSEVRELIKGLPAKYRVLRYHTGDKFCHSIIVASVEVFTKCLHLTLSGKMPPTIPYNAIFEIFDHVFTDNGVSFDISDVIKEIVIAQIYRDKKNPSHTFAHALHKNPKLSMYDYAAANPRKITRNQSIYTGLVFEDFDTMAVSGLNRMKAGKEDIESPMETVLKF